MLKRTLAATLVATILALGTPAGAFAFTPNVDEIYREQVASQRTITAIVDNEVASIYISHARRYRNSATAPVTVRFRNGTQLSGTLLLGKYKGKWYVNSITAGPHWGGVSTQTAPGIPSSVIGTCVTQQRKNQTFALGVLFGRFHNITITSVGKNWGTATAWCRLSGGSSRTRKASMAFLSRVGTNGRTYWFLAAVR